MQYTTVASALFFVGCCVVYGIAAYMFLTSMADDIKNEYYALNDDANSEKDPSEFLKQFNEIIRFHSTTIELSFGKILYKFYGLFPLQMHAC